jgi:tetratricopeptide (TPR) repeat protein
VLNLKAFASALFLGVVMSGCAAMGVPETTDADKKIRQAYMLFDEQQRPLPAERLIREAIGIYQDKNNELGLAEAYRAYGFFFRSTALEKWHNYYESNGFMEEGATFANRHAKSIAYFEKSAVILEKHNKHAALTNVRLNMGFTYEFASQPQKACEEYKKSIISNRRHMKENPGATLSLPKGFTSYEEYVNPFLERLKCANEKA